MEQTVHNFITEAEEKVSELESLYPHPFFNKDNLNRKFIVGAIARVLAHEAKIARGEKVAPLIDVAEDLRIKVSLGENYTEFANAVIASLTPKKVKRTPDSDS